ncbi:hypothetical protein ABW19_dt0206970 [Dactylella cylindrospora]|nr:hypothetical protein ABW19_dt0206970 [Dactylella cylindrospora]
MDNLKQLLTILLLSLSLLSSSCLSIPVVGNEHTPIIHNDIGYGNTLDGIIWTGAVRPGGSNVTFHGTVSEIKHQIESHPDFDSSIYGAVNFTALPPSIGFHDIYKRQGAHYIVDCSRSARPIVGRNSISYLLALRDLKSLPGQCSVTGEACRRFSCYQTASLALCVRRQQTLIFNCAELGRIAEIMITNFIDNSTQRRNNCRYLDGDKDTAFYFIGRVYWSADGPWWYVNALYQPC